MSMQDTVADMLTRIRNAQLAHKQTVATEESYANVLLDEGYISSSRRFVSNANGQ